MAKTAASAHVRDQNPGKLAVVHRRMRVSQKVLREYLIIENYKTNSLHNLQQTPLLRVVFTSQGNKSVVSHQIPETKSHPRIEKVQNNHNRKD